MASLKAALFILFALTLANKSGGQGTGRPNGTIEWIASINGTTTELPITFTPLEPPESCPPCQCGLARRARPEWVIVGGEETRVLAFPWMALLMYNGRFCCGGSLISDRYILTAAHCTTGFLPERMSVRLLEHDRSVSNETETITRKVSRVVRHIRYNSSTHDNDIALLKLDEPIDFRAAFVKEENETTLDTVVRPVCLAVPGKSFSNYSGLVIGWGKLEETGSISETLQQVNVTIISNAECRATPYGDRITDNMLCAGEPEGGEDACQGDSGGPLHVLNDTTQRYHEVGVVSWGEGCARPERPGVYTRVNRYLTWLASNTRDSCYCSQSIYGV